MKKTDILPSDKIGQSTPDDFKQIHGIGASVEDHLHKAGILTFDQLAEQKPQELALLLEDLVGFTPERISDQAWIEQAQAYVSKTDTFPKESELLDSQNQQHYEVFTVELLIDADNFIRRTRALHVQDQHEEIWAGWDGERLKDFFFDRASLQQIPISESVEHVQQELLTEAPLPVHAENEAKIETSALTTQDKIKVIQLEPRYPGSGNVKGMIPVDQPFNMRISLDLTDIDLSRDAPINYSAAIYARKMGTGERLSLGESHGTFMPADNFNIDVGAKRLSSSGTYKMDVFVNLSLPDQDNSNGNFPMAMLEGATFHVY